VPQTTLSSKSDIKEPDFVRGIPLFAGLSEEEKDGLLKAGRVHSYQRRQTIFRQGDPLHNFYIVCNGTVQLFRTTPDGREITLEILTDGDMSCTREIFELSGKHMVNAAAVNDTTIMSFPKTWLLETAQKNSMFALNLLSTISNRTRMIEVDAEHQATMSAPQLVACFLLHQCARYDLNPRGFDLTLSKSLIASRLGMELETFSRTLPTLKKYGITVKGKHVILQDFPSIEENVCGHCSIRESCQARKTVWEKKEEAAQKIKSDFKLTSS
jgi:CRP-like cAMP-binding protein